MAIDPISIGLGAASLFGGKNAQKKAESAQKKAAKGQEAITERALRAWDKIYGEVEKAAGAGQFDPERIIEQLKGDYEKDTKTATENVAGAFRVAGAQPGDSETALNIRSISNQRNKDWDKMKVDIRRQSFLDKLNAYGAASGQGGLNLAANIYGQQGAQAQAQQPQGLGALLGSISPFLSGSKQLSPLDAAVRSGKIIAPDSTNPFYR